MATRRQQLEAMLADDPDDDFLNYALALELAAEGQTAGAVERLRGQIARSPGYVPAYLKCGQFLQQVGDVASARQVLRQGMAIAEKSGDLHAAGEMQELLNNLS
jgi:Tfp pilus assembly protein PilF